jgi:hypothetical protein
MFLHAEINIKRNKDKTSCNQNGVYYAGPFDNRGIYSVIQSQCLKSRLKPMQQMKCQQYKTSNIEQYNPSDVEFFNHQYTQIMVILSIIYHRWNIPKNFSSQVKIKKVND